VLDTPARARRWVSEMVVRFVKALEALEADGRVRRVGSVSVLRVYDRPYIFVRVSVCMNGWEEG